MKVCVKWNEGVRMIAIVQATHVLILYMQKTNQQGVHHEGPVVIGIVCDRN